MGNVAAHDDDDDDNDRRHGMALHSFCDSDSGLPFYRRAMFRNPSGYNEISSNIHCTLLRLSCVYYYSFDDVQSTHLGSTDRLTSRTAFGENVGQLSSILRVMHDGPPRSHGVSMPDENYKST